MLPLPFLWIVPVDRSSFGGCCRSWSGSYGSRASFCPHHVSARAECVSSTRGCRHPHLCNSVRHRIFQSAREFFHASCSREHTRSPSHSTAATSLSIRAFVKRASGTTSLVRHFSCSVASPLNPPPTLSSTRFACRSFCTHQATQAACSSPCQLTRSASV